MNKLILLDRDGTLIVNKHYLNDPDDIEYLPGVESALKKLSLQGYQFAIVTNQSGIPRGHIQIENMHEIHRRMKHHFHQHNIKLEHFYFSPHLPESDHPSRKPNAGMLRQALMEMDGSIDDSWMIGDKMIDVEAGHRAGLRSGLLGHNFGSFPEDWVQPEVHAEDWDSLITELLKQL